MEEQIRKELYEKMQKEISDFKAELRTKTPDEIINSAYEIALKDEMICNFYPGCLVFDIEDIKRLNKCKYPMQELYDDWMDSDTNINSLLEDNIDEFFLELKEEQDKHKRSLER